MISSKPVWGPSLCSRRFNQNRLTGNRFVSRTSTVRLLTALVENRGSQSSRNRNHWA
jgi:hypothetical protein